MIKRNILIILVSALLLGIVTILVMNGVGLISLAQFSGSNEVIEGGRIETPTSVAASAPTSKTITSTALPITRPDTQTAAPPALETPFPTPNLDPTETLAPIEAAAKEKSAPENTLLIYDSTQVQNSDINFCKLSEFYGLQCNTVDLNTSALKDEMLRDAQGNYFKLIAVNGSTLMGYNNRFSQEEISILKSAVINNDINLLISKANVYQRPRHMAELTAGAVWGIVRPPDKIRNWTVSSASPEITQEFTGLAFDSTSTPQTDFALRLGQPLSVTTLISSTDDVNESYPIFVRVQMKKGSIFVDAGAFMSSLDEIPLKDMYFGTNNFTQIIPTMLLFPYTFGAKVWHSDHHYANFSLENPGLTQISDGINYAELLRSMETYQFHTTISLTPSSLEQASLDVLTLFRIYPDYFSNGFFYNNEGIYDLYSGENPENITYLKDPAWLAQFYKDQENEINKNLGLLENQAIDAGLTIDKVVVFPWAPSPETILSVFKQKEFLAAVSIDDVPLGGKRPARWDYGMYPLVLDYGGLPVLIRQQFSSLLKNYPFDLFIDRPMLFSIDPSSFSQEQGRLNSFVRQLNSAEDELEWLSLDQVPARLYLEKHNNDGSMDIKMFSSSLKLRNVSNENRTFHIVRQGLQQSFIDRVTVNGSNFPYFFSNGDLLMDMIIPAGSTAEIIIHER